MERCLACEIVVRRDIGLEVALSGHALTYEDAEIADSDEDGPNNFLAYHPRASEAAPHTWPRFLGRI
jgi:hypothetical protein